MDSVFDELYRKYHHDVLQFLFYMVKNKEQAEDLVQEVYIRVLKSYDRFEGKSSEKTWLFSIARNVAIDSFRKQKGWKQRILEKFDWSTQQVKDTNPIPEEITIQREEIQHIYQCLDLCTIDQRLVIIMRYIHELSITETAEALDWTESKVKTTQHRAIKVLKKHMEEISGKEGVEMKKKSEWDDKQLEELLSQMPKIKDERSPQEIYQNIQLKMNKRKQRAWVMPSVAAAAAVLLFFILAPNLLNWNNSGDHAVENREMSTASEDSVEENMALTDEAGPSIMLKENQEEASQTEEAEDSQIMMDPIENGDSAVTAVYEQEVGNNEVLTYAIPDTNAMLAVPVSVIVPKEENKSKVNLYEEQMKNLREEEWGLSDYYPLHADLIFNEESKTLTVDVPTNHPYSMGSASELMFSQVLSYTMATLDVDKINLSTEGQPGIDFAHFGYQDEFIREDQTGNHAYYIYHTNASVPKPFIVPYGGKLNSIEEAFSEMKKNREEANLVASIPMNVNFEIEENPAEQKLTIYFSEDVILTNDSFTLNIVEAILLTAKDFGFQTVKLENTNIDQIGIFDLNKEIKVPVAANKRSLPQ